MIDTRQAGLLRPQRQCASGIVELLCTAQSTLWPHLLQVPARILEQCVAGLTGMRHVACNGLRRRTDFAAIQSRHHVRRQLLLPDLKSLPARLDAIERAVERISCFAHIMARPLRHPCLPLPYGNTTCVLGLRCPVDLAGRLATQGDLLTGACQGTMPAHLAALLVALPEQDIHLPRNWREREVQQKAWFKAVPGYGQRPDFIVRMGDVWVRSLEGRDADSTFYLVSAPFTCSDQVANRDDYSAEPVRVPAGSCREAYVGQRVYQVRGDAPPRDVTAEAMPAMPQVTEADRARQLARGGRITLDHSKLQFGPAMRWFVQYPETVPKGGARAFSDWNREHLAFVVWTGDHFELRDKVPRSQWPCDPVAPGDRACGGFPDSGPDLFVTASASAPVAATSP